MAKEVVHVRCIDDFDNLREGQKVRVKESKTTETYLGIESDNSCSPACFGNRLIPFHVTADRDEGGIFLRKYFIFKK